MLKKSNTQIHHNAIFENFSLGIFLRDQKLSETYNVNSIMFAANP